MRTVIQRVTKASVNIDGNIFSEINNGLLVLLGIENSDTQDDIDWLVKKIIQLRIFDDENGLMNLSVKDINGELLVVSQFTLFASTKKGNRPSFINSAKPDVALPLYKLFIANTELFFGKKIKTGEFAAAMKISLINDGPATIIIDTKNRE